MRIGGSSGDGPVSPDAVDDTVTVGEDFYGIMLEAIGAAPDELRLELAGALNTGRPWGDLSDEARQLFEAVAETVLSDDDGDEEEGGEEGE